jgi:hypothetical protein
MYPFRFQLSQQLGESVEEGIGTYFCCRCYQHISVHGGVGNGLCNSTRSNTLFLWAWRDPDIYEVLPAKLHKMGLTDILVIVPWGSGKNYVEAAASVGGVGVLANRITTGQAEQVFKFITKNMTREDDGYNVKTWKAIHMAWLEYK